jgi:hypothetical protein
VVFRPNLLKHSSSSVYIGICTRRGTHVCPLVRIGPPPPSPPSDYVYPIPRNQRGGYTHLRVRGGVPIRTTGENAQRDSVYSMDLPILKRAFKGTRNNDLWTVCRARWSTGTSTMRCCMEVSSRTKLAIQGILFNMCGFNIFCRMQRKLKDH